MLNLYNRYYQNNYEELITYYPLFYREIYEMKEILKAQGKLADDLEACIERILSDCFIDTADSGVITSYENILGIKSDLGKPLEERRRLVKAYLVGSGKASATSVCEMIKTYTGAEAECSFSPYDEKGNNVLNILAEHGNSQLINIKDINVLLSEKLPAHIQYNLSINSVVPIEFVYTGFEQELLKVYTPNDEEYKVEYQCYEPQSKGGFYVNNWTTTPPTATNCGDESLKYYYAVRITASDSDQPLYQITYDGTSSDSLLHVTSIKTKSLQSDDIVVTLTPQTFRYDGTVKKPAIEIIDTVIKTEVKRYGISYSYAAGEAADNPKEAGTYKVYILIDANYTGDRYVYFTIEKQKLTPVAVISNASKTYDGTTSLASGQTIALTLQDEAGNTVLDGVSARYEAATYESKDVGPNSIQITGISLTGENADKYDLSASTLSISGNIDQASAEKLVPNVTYPGNNNVIEYENRGTFLPTVTVSSNISGDQVGSYVVSYSATQEGSYVSDLKGVMQNLNVQETEQTILLPDHNAEL